MELYCKVCDERITLRNITRERNIGGGSLRCCNQCGKSEQDRLKEKYYVETYNGEDIYMKDGVYLPYFECTYCFKTLDDCKKRIDAEGIAIPPLI